MKFTSILFAFLFIWCTTTPVVEPHSVMTHASMDVGNIISIVIPENSPANINIDQLTLDFRRQLERIKQNQILDSDYKSVSLKNKLSDVSNNRDQREKSVDKAYQGKINYYYYYLPQKFKINSRNLKKKYRSYQRHSSSFEQNKKNFGRHNNIIIKSGKFQKNPSTYLARRDFYQFRKIDGNVDDDNNQEKYEKNKDWNQVGAAAENFANKINQIKVSSVTYKNNEQQQIVQSTEPRVELSCLVVNKENKVGSTKDMTTNEFEKNNAIDNDCTEEIDTDGQVILSCYNESTTNSLEPTKGYNKEEDNFGSKEKNDDTINNGNVNETINNNDYDKVKQKIFPINIQVEDFREVERIIQNPEDILDNFNSSNTENDVKIDGDDNSLNTNIEVNDNLQNAALLTSINRGDRHLGVMDNDSKGLTNSLYEYVDKNHGLIDDEESITSDQATYQNGMRNILKADDENFEIRIQRSVNDNVLMKKSTNAHVPKQPDVKKSKVKEKVKWVPMKTTIKSKNSWKLYPNISNKSATIKSVD